MGKTVTQLSEFIHYVWCRWTEILQNKRCVCDVTGVEVTWSQKSKNHQVGETKKNPDSSLCPRFRAVNSHWGVQMHDEGSRRSSEVKVHSLSCLNSSLSGRDDARSAAVNSSRGTDDVLKCIFVFPHIVNGSRDEERHWPLTSDLRRLSSWCRPWKRFKPFYLWISKTKN